MDLANIRSDLKTRLATIGGLTAYDTVPGKPEVPCAIVHPTSINPHASLGAGVSDVRFTVQVLVQLTDWPTAQNALDNYASLGNPSSIVGAIENQTVGGEFAVVELIDNYGAVDFDQNKYGTVTFHVLIPVSS